MLLARVLLLFLPSLTVSIEPSFSVRGGGVQRNYVEYSAPSPLHGIPSDSFRVPYPQMYESYTNEATANGPAGMSTSADSSGRVITSLSMGLRRTKEDEMRRVVPREKMVHGLREIRKEQEQVPAATITERTEKRRRKTTTESSRRRPTSDELYSDMFPTAIQAAQTNDFDFPDQLSARDAPPTSLEQLPTRDANPNSNNLVRVIAAQVPIAQIEPVDITKGLLERALPIEPIDYNDESTELVPGPLPPAEVGDINRLVPSLIPLATKTEAAPPPTPQTPPTEAQPPQTPPMSTTVPPTPHETIVLEMETVATVAPAPASSAILPRGQLETIPASLLADDDSEESEIVETAKNIVKKHVEPTTLPPKDEVVEKSAVIPNAFTRSLNYIPPPPPVRREVMMAPRCSYDPELWAMHPKSAVTSATMFARTTGGSCEECLKECSRNQKAPWLCRSVTYDATWKICDLFAVSATANPFHLVHYEGRDYFEYLPAAPPSDEDLKSQDEFTLIQKHSETVNEMKTCEQRLHELEIEISQLKGLGRTSIHAYSITTPPSLPDVLRASGVSSQYDSNPISHSDILSIDSAVQEGSASLTLPSRRISEAVLTSSKKKMLQETPVAFRRRIGGRNKNVNQKTKTIEEQLNPIEEEIKRNHEKRITETHVRVVNSERSPIEAHKEFVREVKLAKINARASAVSTSMSGPALSTKPDESMNQIDKENEHVKNDMEKGPKGGIKLHKIAPVLEVNSASADDEDGYEKKNLVPPSAIERESNIPAKTESISDEHPQPLSGDPNKLPPLIEHPTWAVLAGATNGQHQMPGNAIVTSTPLSCRGRAPHVFVSFAQTDVPRIGLTKDCPALTVEQCARACDKERYFECVAFVVDLLGCHLLSVRPDHRNAASFTRVQSATFAEKICLNEVSRVQLHGVLGAAREHLLIGTVTNMASSATLSDCIEECATSQVRRGLPCSAAMWYPKFDAQNCHLSQQARVTHTEGANLLNSNAIYFEMPPMTTMHRRSMNAITLKT